VLDHLRIRYLEGVEDPLVDQANILAAIAGNEMEKGSLDEEGGIRISMRSIPRTLVKDI
jgi:hypothetical protein